jgi:hypothetical protein
MGSYAQNIKNTSLNSILNRPMNSEDFKLVDYVVDLDKLSTSGTPWEEIENSAYVFEMTLRVNIDKLLDTRISGYTIQVQPQSNHTKDGPIKEERVYKADFTFTDDFPDLIDTGETDFAAVKQKIKAAKSLLVASQVDPAGTYSDSDITTQPSPTYVEITGAGSFAELAREMLMNGDSPDDQAQFSMPIYAVPSAKTSLGSVPNIGSNSGANDITVLMTPEIQERASLTKMRKEELLKNKTTTPASYKIEQSVVNPGLGTSASIILGKTIQYTSPVFTSTRRFEVPTRCLQPFTKIDILIRPILSKGPDHTDDGKVEVDTGGESIVFPMGPARKALLTPVIPPSITILANTPGSISYCIDRGDPVTRKVILVRKYFNPKTGMLQDAGTTEHFFNPHTMGKVFVMSRKTDNVFPYVTRLTAITQSPSGNSVSTEVSIVGHKNKLFSSTPALDTSTIAAFNTIDGLNIEISNIPGTAVSITLFREDMMLPLSSDRRTVKISKEFLGETAGSPVEMLSFLDADVFNLRTYRYFAICESMNSTRASAGPQITESFQIEDDEIIIRKTLSDLSLFSASIQYLGTSVASSGLENSFKPSAAVISDDFDFVVQGLQQRGMSQEFSKELQENKSKFVDLVGFIVERIDRTTGQRSTLGLAQPDETFVDSGTGLTGALNPMHRYTYVFKLCIFNPGPIITFGGDTSSASFQKDTALLSSALTAATGIMPASEDLLIDASSSSEIGTLIKSADTGKEYIVQVEPDPSVAIPLEFSGNVLSTTSPHSYKLQWSAPAASRTEIDAFYVFCNYNGVKSVIQTIATRPSDATNTYSYVDNEYFNEVGLKVYTVAAKFNDFTFGPETHEIQVFKAISSPLDMIATPADLYGKTNLKSTPNPTNSTNMTQAPLALDISDLVPTPNSWITDF